MSLKQDFSKAVKDHFVKIEPALDAELTLISLNLYPSSVKFLLFEYDSPQFSQDFSVSLWAMNAHGEPVGEGYWLLKGKEVAVPAETYDAEQYEEISPWFIASELLERWLTKRWSNIVSAEQTYPAFIGHHDSYFKKNLLTGRQINWDEIIAAVNA